MLQARIWDVPGSTVTSETHYYKFLVVFVDLSDKFWESTIIGPGGFLSNYL